MEIRYSEQKDFKATELEELFLSVEWSSGHFPDKLCIAMQNSSRVFSAWDGTRLIGLINVLDDSIMTAYIHYLLVHPQYQKQGIGQSLLNLVKEQYSNFLRIVLVAYATEAEFYSHNGFSIGDGKIPMFKTSLWT